MSWNTVPARSRSNPSAAGLRTADSGSKRRAGMASIVRHTTPYRRRARCRREAGARPAGRAIDCPHAAHDRRRGRVPRPPGLPGALCRALRGAGPGAGALRRRPRPAGGHRGGPGLPAPGRVRPGARSARRSAPPSSLPEALDGADMVFAAIRPGGTAGRTADERIAQDLGLLGQETTGAGGISYALRSIPPMLRLAEEMRSRCPGRLAAQLHQPRRHGHGGPGPRARAQGDRDLRLRRRPGAPRGAGRRRRAARGHARRRGLLRPEPPRLAVPAGGRGPGRPPGLLANPAALSEFEEGRLFPPGLLASLGCLPNEYLFYYYDTARAVAGMRAAGQTRGESIARQQAELYPRLAAAGAGRFPRCGRPPAGPARRATSPRPAPRASAATRPTSPAAATSGWRWRPCAPSPAAARRT